MFLWKPVLSSFIDAIDKLAHLKYVEYGKVPSISQTLRKVMKSNKRKDAFGELIKKCKRLTLFALISSHSSLKLILDSIEAENKERQLFQVTLDKDVHNFTVNLITKWMSEYSPTSDEYDLKIDLLLGRGKAPMKMSDKAIDEFFMADPKSKKFLANPLTVLSFDDSSTAPYAKSIHHFIDMARNLLKFEEDKAKSKRDMRASSFSSVLDDTDLTPDVHSTDAQSLEIDSVIYEILERTRISLNFGNHENAYTNFMTLQCIYLIVKDDPVYAHVPASTTRELINSIVIIGSLGPNSCLLAFNQFVEYLHN